jgi:hypothetical protein
MKVKGKKKRQMKKLYRNGWKNKEKNVKESNATKEGDCKNTSRLTYIYNMKEKNGWVGV